MNTENFKTTTTLESKILNSLQKTIENNNMGLNIQDLRIGIYVEKSLKSGNGRKVIDKIGCQDIVKIVENTGSFNYQPIPISEDWLIKAGFIENKYEYSIPISDCGLVTLTLIPHDEQHSKFSVCVSQSDEHDVENVFLNEISFWHELQNLYKSISGKELNFTP